MGASDHERKRLLGFGSSPGGASPVPSNVEGSVQLGTSVLGIVRTSSRELSFATVESEGSGELLNRVADDVRLGCPQLVVIGAAPGHGDGGETGPRGRR